MRLLPLPLPKPDRREKSLVQKSEDLVQFKSGPPLIGYVTSGRSRDLSRPELPHPSAYKWSFFLINLFFNGRIIALLNFAVFCQTATWISHRYTYVPSLLNLPPTYRWSLRSLGAPHFYNKEQAEEHLLLKGLEVGQRKMSKRKEALDHVTGVRRGLSPLWS